MTYTENCTSKEINAVTVPDLFRLTEMVGKDYTVRFSISFDFIPSGPLALWYNHLYSTFVSPS